MILLFFQGRRWDESKDASIFGAELKNGEQLCVNYFKRRDLYEKRIIFINLNRQKCFLICKSMPVRFIFVAATNEQVFVRVAFGLHRQFANKLSLGTDIPSHLRANNL